MRARPSWRCRALPSARPARLGIELLMSNMIVVSGLGKTYRLGSVEVPALLTVSFQIARGEFVAIMGPSGSGKSTLMNLLGCLDTPSSGRYWLDGEEVSQLDGNALAALRARKLGFVF